MDQRLFDKDTQFSGESGKVFKKTDLLSRVLERAARIFVYVA
jgi:hypothetical protein